MYIIKVLDKATGAFSEYEVAGKFARKERAEGALTALERLGEDRAMKVELVDPGKRGNMGRTEHGAALATTNGRHVQDPKRLAQLRASIANARAVKAAKRAQVKETVTNETIRINAEDVAKLIGSIRPEPSGSGEYVLDVNLLRRTGT